MTDPGNAYLTRAQFRELGGHTHLFPWGKKRGNHHLREKIAFMPSLRRLHRYMVLGESAFHPALPDFFGKKFFDHDRVFEE